MFLISRRLGRTLGMAISALTWVSLQGGGLPVESSRDRHQPSDQVSPGTIFADGFENGGTLLWSITEVDPPTLSVQAPVADQIISIQYTNSTPGWSVDGTDAVGTVSFTSSGTDGGTFTLRYAGEGPLLDSTGTPFVDRPLAGAGAVDVSDVHLPSRDESGALALEVQVTNVRGTVAAVSVQINVDVIPPSAVQLDTDAPDPGTSPTRSGANELDWQPSTDDLSGGGGVMSYELRAIGRAAARRLGHQRLGRPRRVECPTSSGSSRTRGNDTQRGRAWTRPLLVPGDASFRRGGQRFAGVPRSPRSRSRPSCARCSWER